MALPERHVPKQREFPDTAPDDRALKSVLGVPVWLIQLVIFAVAGISLFHFISYSTSPEKRSQASRFNEYVANVTPDSLTHVTAKIKQLPSDKNANLSYTPVYLDVVGSGPILQEYDSGKLALQLAICPWRAPRGIHNCGSVFEKEGAEKVFKVGFVLPNQDTEYVRDRILIFYIAELDEAGDVVKEVLAFEHAQTNYVGPRYIDPQKKIASDQPVHRLHRPGPSH